jgi:hypothetical protein
MIAAIAAAVFFLAVAAALQFSSWAEGWLASGARPARALTSNVSSIATSDSSEPVGVVGTVHAA